MSWKVVLPCTRAEAEAVKGDIAAFAALDCPPVLMTSEVDPARPGAWRLDAYFEAEPTPGDLATLKALVPSAGRARARVEKLPEADWLTLSQAGLEPIRAGRFLVHTPAHRGAAPAGVTAFEIEAGRAFGTGHHETTAGCLAALDRLKRRGAVFANIADIGTGTGLLAFAALELWPAARAIASDIDPVAIEVARDNATVNRVPLGRGPGRLALAIAPGLAHRALIARAPYDLVVANILAGPLMELAPQMRRHLAPGGSLVLSGILERQHDAVVDAYAEQGFRRAGTLRREGWVTIHLE